MNILVQQIYWLLPGGIKNIAASLNAIKLDRQRYNESFSKMFDQLQQQIHWSLDQYKAYQEKQFNELIQIAVSNTPYYRQLFRMNHLKVNDIKGIGDLGKIPVLEKSVLREQPEALLDETLDKKKLMPCSTSGTTGTPLRLYRTKYLNAVAFALVEARNHAVARMQRRRNRSVSFGGHLVASPNRNSPPFWVYNQWWDQLYMSSYHLSPDYLGYYVDKLRSFRADYIEGYPSSVCSIAQYIVENNLPPVNFKACFTTAEPLSDIQRQLIRKAFYCRAFNQYGCAELAIFASECIEGNMHLSPEVSYVEVLDDDNRPVPSGEEGHLVCTTLLNKIQPLIRYKIGDYGAIDMESQCKCGFAGPILKSIEGRSDDLLITKDGKRIGRLDPVFKGIQGVRESQIVQKDFDKYVVFIVPAKEYTSNDGTHIIRNMAQRVGTAEIRIQLVNKIDRTAAGKFKSVICELPGQVKKEDVNRSRSLKIERENIKQCEGPND